MKRVIKGLLISLMTIGLTVGCHDASGISLSINSSSSEQSSASISSSIVPHIIGINLNTDSVKKDYYVGENLNLSGLVVNALYDNQVTTPITNYTTNPANGTTLNTIGEVEVTVSYETFNQKFNVTVAKAPKTTWTEEESLVMSEHLYGVVLPFTGYEQSTVSYDSKNAQVIIEGGKTSQDDLLAYKNKLSTIGFEGMGSSPVAYALEKEVRTDAGRRFVYVYFCIDDNNDFYLVANDPYYYSFPTKIMDAVASVYFTSAYGIPAFTAEYYELDLDQLAIYGCYESTTDDGGYSDILREAGWNIRSQKDSQGFYLADSPDKAYIACYQYTQEYNALVIYLIPTDSWNNALIETFFKKYKARLYDIPVFECTNGGYQFIESENNDYYYETGNYSSVHAFMYVHGATLVDLFVYYLKLSDAGWNAELSSDSNYIKAQLITIYGVANLEVEYMETKGLVELVIYPFQDELPSTYWPTGRIVDYLGEDVTDVVPEFTGENKGFTFLSDRWGGYSVVVKVEKGTEDANVNSYKTLLTNSGWEPMTDRYYISPNKQIAVEVYKGLAGEVTVYFSWAPFKEWPASKIAELFERSGYEETLPAIVGAQEYNILYWPGKFIIEVVCDNAEEVAEEFYYALQDLGYTSISTYMVSPSGTFGIDFYRSVSDRTIFAQDAKVFKISIEKLESA